METNSIVRENIIYKIDLDICLSIETHPKRNEDIHVPGFNLICQNRARSKRQSRGVGFLIKWKLFSEYYVDIIDQSFDGILVVSLDHKLYG